MPPKEIDVFRELPAHTKVGSSIPGLNLACTDPLLSSSAATYATKLHAKSIPLVNPQRLSAAATKKQAGQARRKQDGIRAGTIGLRTVWEEYMVQLLGMGGTKPNVKTGLGGKWAGNAEALQNKIAKAEFTGCFLTVKVSSNKDLISESNLYAPVV
ncbi:hypothetical protein [Phaffia rhodozyma]|uniref:Uncharacterized protein n=1 Tax=Phaffia rhodozyma TaxID=264483 RepID=A0A0F7SS35_PHARH|nr:hypothetical protein [Phaffia rhodozyma]